MARSDSRTETLADAIKRVGITMTVRPGPSSRPGWEWDATHWRCTLRVGVERMRVTFSQGSGHKGRPPSIKNVLDCILSDAGSVENAGDFYGWCIEAGYDSDSLSDRAIYARCKRQTAAIKRLLGADFESVYGAERD